MASYSFSVAFLPVGGGSSFVYTPSQRPTNIVCHRRQSNIPRILRTTTRAVISKPDEAAASPTTSGISGQQPQSSLKPIALDEDDTITPEPSSIPDKPVTRNVIDMEEVVKKPIESLNRRKTGVNMGSHRMRVFSGTSNCLLADSIARYVGKSRSSSILRKRFSDGETYVRVEESVRGCNVFIVQSTSKPVNDNLMELLIMIDACRRASAQQITVVMPYYGYSRADRLIDPSGKRREALTSKLVANMLIKAGTDRVVLVDIHSPQTCGFFDIPVDHVYASQVLIDYLNKKKLNDFVVVAPDAGGVGRARWFAKGVNDAPLAFIDKRRDEHNVAKVLHLIGDVRGKTAVLVDDMIDTAGTITEAAKMLRKCGARQVYALTTHPVFSGPAIDRLSSGCFEEVIVTDTIHLPQEMRFKQLKILSVAPLLGEQIWKIHEQNSR